METKLFTVILLVFNLSIQLRSQVIWSSVGNGQSIYSTGTVSHVVTDNNGQIYIGGTFWGINQPDYTPIYYVATYSGGSWIALGGGTCAAGTIKAMVTDGTNVYIGGEFSKVGGDAGLTVNGIAKWNGNSWSALGSGVAGTVYAIALNGNDVYVSTVSYSSSAYHYRVYKWDGTSWTKLGGDFNYYVYSLEYYNGNLYAGGSFYYNYLTELKGFAKWDGTAWSCVGNGIEGGGYAIRDMCFDGSNIYVCGSFRTVGNTSPSTTANRVAKWNGTSWTTYDAGLDYEAFTILNDGDNIYVAGSFDHAGGLAAAKIALWKNNAWQSIGGADGYVWDMFREGSLIYTVGDFHYVDVEDFNIHSDGIAKFTIIAPFPVELQCFQANIQNNKVLLSWTTATEVNNYGFNVERRVKNEEWTMITFVQGHGNSNSPKEYFFGDSTITYAEKYYYRLKQIDFNGKFEYSDIIEVNVETPVNFSVRQNYPNPFNPQTNINYQLPVASNVTLMLYNIIGERIATLINQYREAGSYTYLFDATKIIGGLTSGVYFYTMQFTPLNGMAYSKTNKLILTK